MISKLILAFTLVAISVYTYIQYKPVIVTAPTSVSANSFFEVTSNKSGDWLVTGAVATFKSGKRLIVLAGVEEIKIIYSPGLIRKTVKISKAPSAFVLKIRSWAPVTGREAVATSLEAIANGFDGKEINDFIKLTRLNNKILIDSNWKSFFQKLANYCEENMAEADLAAHRELWLRIAEALKCKEETS